MQGENERQWKKVNENTYDIIYSLHKTSCCSRAKQRQRNVQKRVLHVQIKVFCFFSFFAN